MLYFSKSLVIKRGLNFVKINTMEYQTIPEMRDKCRNCGQPLYGEFCHNCGQKEFNNYDLTIKNFIIYFIGEFWGFDAKIFKSLLYIIIKPGYLTREFSMGRLARYLMPLKLYLLVSIIFFFAMELVSPITMDSIVGKNDPFFTKERIEKIASDKGLTAEEFEKKFDEKSQGLIPIYLLVIIFLFSLPLKLIYIRSKKFYVEHLVFSLHIYTFMLITWIVLTPVANINVNLYSYGLTLIMLAYIFFAIKNFYRQNILKTIVKSGIMFLWYMVLLVILSFSIFLITAISI